MITCCNELRDWEDSGEFAPDSEGSWEFDCGPVAFGPARFCPFCGAETPTTTHDRHVAGDVHVAFIRDESDPRVIRGVLCSSRDDRPLDITIRRQGYPYPIVLLKLGPRQEMRWTLYMVEAHQGEIYYKCLSPDAAYTD